MKYDLTLFFKLDKITEIMDHCDLSEMSQKIFCRVIDISIDASDDWYLSPAVAEAIEDSFLSSGLVEKIVETDDNQLCGIYDAAHDVFYNFTEKRRNIRMFSDGTHFVFFDTKEDIKKDNYQKAYKYFVFNDKQAKNERFVLDISNWMHSDGGENENSKQ